MLHHWIIITVSWLGSVSLQYINTGPEPNVNFETLDGPQYPTSNANIQQIRNHYESLQPETLNDQFYEQDDLITDLTRRRRKTNERDVTNQQKIDVDKDKTIYIPNDDNGRPYVVGVSSLLRENATANEIVINSIEKKYFSPWGGKRDSERTWTWKRSPHIREPSMPKRVRFSPWGGKRSGQMIYKPGSKSSKIIFTSSIPELTRIVANYFPNSADVHLAGFEFIPSIDKRHPIKILALSTKANERTIRDALPFKTFLESLPKMFKPGHPYVDVNLKNDGKRKVKFSAWGGKRAPPIIGPIWTPATEDVKDSTLETILLLRKSPEQKNEQMLHAS